jgi:hypothetical protein
MIPAPRTGAHDDTDAALHAYVAESFRKQAQYAKGQSRFLLTLQTAAGNDDATFQARVAARLAHLADAEQQLADNAKETAR